MRPTPEPSFDWVMDTPIDAASPAPRSRKNTPPVGRRWQPGQSGNPAGRPPRRRTLAAPAAVERALKGLVTVEIDGRPRRLPATEALAKVTLARALAGDTAARRDLLKIQAELELERAAARQARAERACVAAEAAALAAEAEDDEPTFPQNWSQAEFLGVLESWNIVVRRHDGWRIRQWIAHAALQQGPAAEEDYPWAWRGLVDGVGDRRSISEALAMLEAVKSGEVSIEAAERWRPGQGVERDDAHGRPQGAPDAAAGREDAGAPRAADAAAAPVEEDWVERLARRGERASPGDWG